jgi:hypothetical protein
VSAQHQPPTEDAPRAPRANETEAIGIEERLTQILRRHRVGPGQVCRCECAPGYLTHSEHVASVLVTELGLAEEWCARHESGGGGIYTDYDDARRFLDRFVERPPAVEDPGSGRYVGLERRYVTSWEPT